MSETHFRMLESMYHKAPINAYFKPSLTVQEGKAEIRMAVRPDFFHAAGAVHGCVYFKALDDAAYFAVNSLVEDDFILTASFNLYLLKPVNQGEMIAYGTVVHQTKNSFIAEAVINDQENNPIARGSGSYIRSKIPLTHVTGYQK